MLYLSRKIGESIIINNTIEMTVVEVRGRTVKIGFTYPPEASVLRKEIYDKIMAENMRAAQDHAGVDYAEMEFDLSHLDTPSPADKSKP
jgi:carbon storage regulator